MGSMFRRKKVRAGRKKQTWKSNRGRKKVKKKIEKQWEKVRGYQKNKNEWPKYLRHTFLLVVISMT